MLVCKGFANNAALATSRELGVRPIPLEPPSEEDIKVLAALMVSSQVSYQNFLVRMPYFNTP
jgi:hypothetical protein